MNVFGWHPENSKHWQSDTPAWLYVRLDLDPSIHRLFLPEGTNHWFEEWHAFDPDGRLHENRLLDGPGPHDLDLTAQAGRIILVYTRFVSFERPPFTAEERQAPEKWHAIDCGSIVHANGGIQKISMAVHENPARRKPLKVPPYARDVLKAIVDAPVGMPPVELMPTGGREHPFQLHFILGSDTHVLLLRNERLPPEIVPGALIRWQAIPKTIAVAVIPAGEQRLAAGQSIRGDWLVALPIVAIDAGRGMVGQPFTLSALITNLTVHSEGGPVWANWEWLDSMNWFKVELRMRFYDDHNRFHDGPPQSRIVTRLDYDRSNCIELFTRTMADEGWNIELTATPILFGCEFPAQTQMSYVRL